MTDPDLPQRVRIERLRDDSQWMRVLRRAGLVYLFSRVCVIIGAAIVAAELRTDLNTVERNFPDSAFADPNYFGLTNPKSALKPITDVLTSWDGAWYMDIVRHGYPRAVQPDVTYFVDDARAAFFPAYPLLVRWVDAVLPGNDRLAALLVNLVLGAVAVLLAGLIARHLYSNEVAEKTMIIMALFPGSFVLSFAYTEALLLALAGGCLYSLLRERWVTAGLCAAVATATRPNGVALILACLVASTIAVHRRRDWRSVSAPAMAPIGFFAFQAWLGQHTGERGVWFRVQTEAWGEGTSFGLTALRNTLDAFTHPLTSPTDTITAISVVALAALVYLAWRERLPWPMVAYCTGVITLMLVPSTVTARPRFVYTAFPLFVPAAVYLQRRGQQWWPYVIGGCSAGLVTLTALYGVLGAIP